MRIAKLKYSLVLAAVLMLCSVSFTHAQSTDMNWESLIDDVVNKTIVHEVDDRKQPALLDFRKPEMDNVKHIIVIPFDNDPTKEVTDRVKIALTNSNYTVVERDDLDKVLQQFAWNIDNDDMVKDDTVKSLGNFLGVDAILYGRVKNANRSVENPQIGVVLKLIDVETTQLLMGKKLPCKKRRTLPPKPPEPGFLNTKNILIIIIVIALLIILISVRPRSKPHLDADFSTRLIQSGDIRQAIKFLRDALDQVGINNDTRELYEKLKVCIDQVDRFGRQVENAPFGAAGNTNPAVAEKIEKFDKSFAPLLAEPKELAARIRDAAVKSENKQMLDLVLDLTKRVSELENKFSERQTILKGNI